VRLLYPDAVSMQGATAAQENDGSVMAQ
jgi:hypothetical protein